MYPLRPRMSKTTTILTTIIIWIFAALLSSPNLIFSTTRIEVFKNGDFRHYCILVWPDGVPGNSKLDLM